VSEVARTQRAATVRGTAAANGAGKLAASVAARIVDDVAGRGWPVGEVIGSEAELLERYGVSRAVFREAVRLVEHQHIARMRRGPGGGLVVTEPDVAAVIDAAVIYLLRVGARLDELFEARLVIEEIVTEVAPERLDEPGITSIRAQVEDEAAGRIVDQRALHTLLARLTGNPALELFVEMLSRLSVFYFGDMSEVPHATVGAVGVAHRKIAEAVCAGDGGLARRRMTTHLRAEAEFIRSRRNTRQALNPAAAIRGREGGKRAEAVARAIFGQVVEQGLEPGTFLGSEPDLISEHEVSRAVLREAVRLLEHHQIAAMRRGPGGGLFVVPEDVTAVCDVIAVYLERHGLQARHLAEMRVGVELALADLVLARPREQVEARLVEALRAEQEAPFEEVVDVVHDLHTALASLGGNLVLELLARILIRLTRLQELQRPARVRRAIRTELHRTHAGIGEALVSGDRDLARHRLSEHLQVLAEVAR
jgi:DNA-binding FadR family transcriptional regulator